MEKPSNQTIINDEFRSYLQKVSNETSKWPEWLRSSEHILLNQQEGEKEVGLAFSIESILSRDNR